MFKLFKKKKPEVVKVEEPKPEEKVPYRYISYKTTKFNVGKTLVSIKFEDGRIFTTLVYGRVNQYVHSGFGAYDYEPRVNNPIIESSLDFAKYLLQNLRDKTTFVDDPENIKNSVVGIPISGSIITTVDHEIEFQEAFIKEEYV